MIYHKYAILSLRKGKETVLETRISMHGKWRAEYEKIRQDYIGRKERDNLELNVRTVCEYEGNARRKNIR